MEEGLPQLQEGSRDWMDGLGELEFPHYSVAHSEEVICHMKKHLNNNTFI